MGKKYDEYAEASKAETAALAAYVAARVSNDQEAAEAALSATLRHQAVADALWAEVQKDPEG